MSKNMIMKALIANAKAELGGGIISDYADVKTTALLEHLKAASAPADTTTSGWATELIKTEYLGFYNLLSENTAYFNLLNNALEVDTSKANLSFAMRDTTGGTVNGAWTKEGDPIPVKGMAFKSESLTGFKLAVICSMTSELTRKSNIESILQSQIISDTVKTLDAKLFSSDAAVSATSPAGLGVGATGVSITSAGASTTAQELIAQISAEIGKMRANGLAGEGSFVFNPEDSAVISSLTDAIGANPFRLEMKNGRFMDQPYLESSEVTQGTFFFIHNGALAMTRPSIELESSNQSTLVMSNPGDDISSGGASAAGVTDESVRSLYQTDTTAIRLIYRDIDFDIVEADGILNFTGYLA